jgi:hypothetical protein
MSLTLTCKLVTGEFDGHTVNVCDAESLDTKASLPRPMPGQVGRIVAWRDNKHVLAAVIEDQ